jgi:hypothetical protein
MRTPPQPQTLTAEQAAERERVYHSLHERALGGSPRWPACVDGCWRQTAMILKLLISLIFVRRRA